MDVPHCPNSTLILITWTLHAIDPQGALMTNFLIRRMGRYSFRRRYPLPIAEILGRTEFVKALGTSDPAEAATRARRVAVEFDDVCAAAMAKPPERALASIPDQPQPFPFTSAPDDSAAILASLPELMKTIILSVIERQSKDPYNWRADVAWRKSAALAHVDGKMPYGYLMHPAKAQAALDALALIESGKHLAFLSQSPINNPAPISIGQPSTPDVANAALSLEAFDISFGQYKIGKTIHRTSSARRVALRVLQLPCTQEQARASIQRWCGTELERGKSASAVRTELSGVVAILKHHEGWESFSLPKTGETKALVGAGVAKRDARKPMPVRIVQEVLKTLPQHLPRGGARWHASALLLALYGMRPRELVGAGPESLRVRKDVFGAEILVFHVGENGAKNEASKRSLPVPPDLEPLFRLALSSGACTTETARTRVDRLSNMVRKSIPEGNPDISLYGMRHLFADVSRACGYTDGEFGPLIGHTSKGGITASYGGQAPLDKASEIFNAVRGRLFPDGLAAYLPAELA